jgi:hypothetical protein
MANGPQLAHRPRRPDRFLRVAHGAEMGFNFHEDQADCYNPSEPGAWDDDLTTM